MVDKLYRGAGGMARYHCTPARKVIDIGNARIPRSKQDDRHITKEGYNGFDCPGSTYLIDYGNRIMVLSSNPPSLEGASFG
jgi:hypothetical protein